VPGYTLRVVIAETLNNGRDFDGAWYQHWKCVSVVFLVRIVVRIIASACMIFELLWRFVGAVSYPFSVFYMAHLKSAYGYSIPCKVLHFTFPVPEECPCPTLNVSKDGISSEISGALNHGTKRACVFFFCHFLNRM